ncbi:MAG TPA: O-methyltransferase [Chitinophagaceae bacterium]|nr:O-methyltransferase [Chitinophagaceae bacterium]
MMRKPQLRFNFVKKAVDIIHPDIQAYAGKYTSAEDALLKEINEYTRQHHTGYHMLSGHLQGKWLEMVSCMIAPSRVLEIGTFMGYSALCLAKGLGSAGKLHTIELREEDAATARRFFERSSYADQIILHTGNALEVIPALEEEWDLVFIDADKVSYRAYLDMVWPRVKKNGFVLADNVFFHGEVLGEPVKGKNAKAISEFNNYVEARDDMDKMMLTLRDGVYLIRKTG